MRRKLVARQPGCPRFAQGMEFPRAMAGTATAFSDQRRAACQIQRPQAAKTP
jgi:hypothetical protein